jgi:hypothetical protein
MGAVIVTGVTCLVGNNPNIDNLLYVLLHHRNAFSSNLAGAFVRDLIIRLIHTCIPWRFFA